MKRLPVLFICFSIPVLCLAGRMHGGEREVKPVPVPSSISVITPDAIRADLEFLASDSLKGRADLTPEFEIAGDYIARRFESFGLRPVSGGYFETFQLGKIRLGAENRLAVKRGADDTVFTLKTDFVPYQSTGTACVSAPVVFAGYGIDASEHGYNDYANADGSPLDVKGKIVFLLSHEPGGNDPKSPFDGVELSEYGQLRMKVQTAVDRGAAGVLIFTDPLNHRSRPPRGFPWPSLNKGVPDDALPFVLVEDTHMPVLEVGAGVASFLFGSVERLRSIQSFIDSTMKAGSFRLDGVMMTTQTTTTVENHPLRNVVACIEGSDPRLKDEVLVIGAHYDHVGIRHGLPAGEDSICNGADDNASGTCGVMAIAEAFAKSDAKPKRTVLFIAFAGEELGLLGSRAYVNAPLYPLSRTVAMLNFDMIGRNGADSLSIVGAPRSPDLAEIVAAEDQEIGMTIRRNERFFNQSDHASFARKRIPMLFFNTEDHADLHKVTDNPDRIDYNKAARISRLGFRVAWHIACSDEHYTYEEKKVAR